MAIAEQPELRYTGVRVVGTVHISFGDCKPDTVATEGLSEARGTVTR